MANFIVAPFPPPVGGVSAAAGNLERVLERHGRRVVRFDTSGHAEREDLYARKKPSSYLRALPLFGRFLREVVLRGSRRDAHHVFVTSDTAFYRDQVFVVVLRALRRRVYVHLHSKTAGEHFVDAGRIRHFGRVLGLADRVFVLSEGHAAFFGRFLPPERIAVLENFVLAEDFVVGDGTRPRDMLYMSRISEMKGIGDLLAALDILVNREGRRDLRVTVAGLADSERTQREVESFIADRGLGDSVVLAGLVLGDEKKRLLARNGVFVFPSRFENSPVTLKEATQAGMAIVASDIAANRAVVDRNGNGLFHEAGSARSLADALRRIIDDPSLFAALRGAAVTCPKYDDAYAWSVIEDYCSD